MTRHKFADVAPAVPLTPASRQAYTYRLPTGSKQTISRYSRVAIPFGRRKVAGVVLKLHNTPPAYQTKKLAASSAMALTPEQVQFARWMARVAQGGLGYTLRLFQPASRQANNASANPPPPVVSTGIAQEPPRALIDHDIEKRARKLGRIIKPYVKNGQQVLILAPEKQLAVKLARALADSHLNPVIVHTKLGQRELSNIWQQVRAAQVHLIIGTQKSLFLPFNNLGLIVIEEEQYKTHKLWDQYPRLHNRYAAQKLASIHRASLLYTSSFSSLFLRHALTQKAVIPITNRPLRPRTTTIDFTIDEKFRRYPLPLVLLTKLRQWQKNDETVLLFYNRRDASLLTNIITKHGIKHKVTLSTSAIFTAQPVTFDRIVWLFPERDLGYPDFRSTEHTLYTLARLHQISGHPKRSIHLLTRRSDLIDKTLRQSPNDIFTDILTKRKKFSYPPYTDLVRLSVTANTKTAAANKGAKLRRQIEQRLSDYPPEQRGTTRIRGPFQDLKQARQSSAQYHLLLSGPLDRLVSLYDNLPVAVADLAPARIL